MEGRIQEQFEKGVLSVYSSQRRIGSSCSKDDLWSRPHDVKILCL